ncbi:ATPase [Lactobacillus pasteurii DSM 23907 = CRBIP 24.76]|uniref:ATPase n=1 Tax=Lactobacillus pasteurii DSM 23907 = CRBIP 24.76 TaxID=1423790 RepID=I7KL03_9LACO|nr:ATPase [Lactobacillus pasteurii DSM 23907 = CRBIP 24.76]
MTNYLDTLENVSGEMNQFQARFYKSFWKIAVNFHILKKLYFLFSKSGFTSDCINLAKTVGCQLIDFEQM